ncbi:MAG TPA: N,N-dimethylformamidase beta subunit family domain-containing protein [Thermoanaerobaculia bacterium]|nr:N,N-dimethylformamidase beta subunit family domain-containing protein [Thermoanaerobaculia bacterium]
MTDLTRRALLAGAGASLAGSALHASGASWAFGSNPTVLENERPGTRAWELTNRARDREIEGYASATSASAGESLSLFVSTRDPRYRVEIYRLGWYRGDGARLVAPAVERDGFVQQTPAIDPATGLVECRWSDPLAVTIGDPDAWPSGIYVAKLTALASGKETHVPFTVRDDARSSALLFQSSVTTWQAYNDWGGKSLYAGSPQARIVSFDRPYASGSGTGDLFRWEYNMARFLEREGYDVAYCTNLDVHEGRARLDRARAFLSVGHDEYWSWEMRARIEAARDAGIGLGFFSGNNCYWQARFAPNAAGAPSRRMISYKEAALQEDPYALDGNPSNDHLVTTQWRSAPVSRPEDSLIGVMYQSGYWGLDADIVIADANHWACAGTGLKNGDHLPGLLGYEVDRVSGNAPAPLELLARSPFEKSGVTHYSDMVSYRAASGATVFATGSIQWSWGLDDWAPSTGSRINAAAQQITRNVLGRLTYVERSRRRVARR